MECIWCGGPTEFVSSGESAGFKCADRNCPGWADQSGDFVGSDGVRRIAPAPVTPTENGETND